MFHVPYESCTEIDLPLKTLWEIFANPTNWSEWDERLDSCILEGNFTAGSIIKIKKPGSSKTHSVFITDVVPYSEFRMLAKSFLISQDGTISIEEITPSKTRATLKTSIKSTFFPLFKTHVMKVLDKESVKCWHSIKEYCRSLNH